MQNRLSNINNEEQLAKVLTEYFSDFSMYAEVPKTDGTIADLVLEKDGTRISLETKLNFTFKLLEQGINNNGYFHYSYIVCPASRGTVRNFQRQLCRDYGVGLIEISESNSQIKVMELVSPVKNLQILSVTFDDWMKKSVAGTKDNRWTAFKETCYQLATALNRHDGLTIHEALEKSTHHYFNTTIAKDLIKSYCISGVIKDFKYDNGRLFLTEIGKNNLKNIYEKWELLM